MKQITIYSKDYCPYCKAAKQILDAKGLSYTEVDVLKQPERLSEMLERSKRPHALKKNVLIPHSEQRRNNCWHRTGRKTGADIIVNLVGHVSLRR